MSMSEPLYSLRGVSIEGPGGYILRRLDWDVRERRVTVLLGPAGTGKSVLLSALAGRHPAPGLRVEGALSFRGTSLWRAWNREVTFDDVVFVPQKSAPAGGAVGGASPLAPPPDGATWLLDEPNAAPAFRDGCGPLVEALRAHRRTGAALVVTHDVGFAREIADDVALFCAGRLEAHGEAAAFFERPPTELAARFIQQGNCWPAAPLVPALPSHFRWILPDQLAGMGRPGLFDEEEADLRAIEAAGITWLISLTSDAPPLALLRTVGLSGRHFQITDMGIPALSPTMTLCRDVNRLLQNGEKVAVHCHAGLGRTGTILAAILVWRGVPPEEAIRTLRNVEKRYIQTQVQEDFVFRFAEAIPVASRPKEEVRES